MRIIGSKLGLRARQSLACRISKIWSFSHDDRFTVTLKFR